jgi:hydrogenase/urease accessory protein HupE
LTAAAPRDAAAHPLAQGTMQIAAARGRLTLAVAAPPEEILIAAAAAGRAQLPPAERLRRHADYLLAHLHVAADGRALAGRIAALPAPDDERPLFTLAYDLPDGGTPARVTVRQDVLRDIGVAFGGPWEASYIVAFEQEGRPPAPVRLLMSDATLPYDLDWTAGGGAAAAGGGDDGGGARLAATYLREGILHILRGYDHLLFVMALVLAAATLSDVVKVVVAFTLAHATTLTLCALGIIRVRAAVFEPLIAASIVAVALQNILTPAASRRAPRLVVAFLFGLFHGCGFAAGALAAMQGLRGGRVGVAVGAFSLGVEIGHQAVVIPLFLALGTLRRHLAHAGRPQAWPRVQRGSSAAIAVAGGLFLISALLAR